MPKSIKEWLAEGEEMYNEAMQGCIVLQKQIADLEAKLQARRQEVNQIGAVIGKPPLDEAGRGTVQLVESNQPGSIPASRNTIAKALAGRGLG